MPHRLAFPIAHGTSTIRSRSHSATRRGSGSAGRRADSAAASSLEHEAFDPGHNEQQKYAEYDEGDGSGHGAGGCVMSSSPDPAHHLYLERHHRSSATSSASNKSGAAAAVAAAAAATAAAGGEDGLSAASSLLFCCLCRCALKNTEAAVTAHLAGRRHVERARAVPTIRVTISLCTSAPAIGAANAAEGNGVPASSAGAGTTRRVQLGLLPALNMPGFWKAVLLALRAEQAAMQRSLAANVAAVGGGAAVAPLGHHPLLTLRLDEPPSLLHPGIVKLKYVSAAGGDERDCDRGGKSAAPSSPLLRPLLHGSDFSLALQSLEELKQIHLVVTDWNDKVAHAASRKKAASNKERGSAAAAGTGVPQAEATEQSSRRESGLLPPLLRAPTRMASSAGPSGRATPSSQSSSASLQRPVRLAALPRGVSISSIESDLAGFSSGGSRGGGGSSHASTAGSSGSDEDREGALTSAISTPSSSSLSDAPSDASEGHAVEYRSPSPASQSALPAPPRPRCRYFSSDPRFNACNRPRCPFGHFDPPQSADHTQQPHLQQQTGPQGQQRWRPVRKSTLQAERESPPAASSSTSVRPVSSTSSSSSRDSSPLKYSSEQLLALGASSSSALGPSCAQEAHARSSSMLIMAQRFGILSPSATATAAAAATAALSVEAGSSTYWSLTGAQPLAAEGGRGPSGSRSWLLDMAGGSDGSTNAQPQQSQQSQQQSQPQAQQAQAQAQQHAPSFHRLHPSPGPAPAPAPALEQASSTGTPVLPPRLFVPIEPAAPSVFARGPRPVLLQPCPIVVVAQGHGNGSGNGSGNGNGGGSGRGEFPAFLSMPQQPQLQPQLQPQFPLHQLAFMPPMRLQHAYGCQPPPLQQQQQQQQQLHQRYLAEQQQHQYQQQRHAHAHAHLSQRQYESQSHDLYERHLRHEQLRQQQMQEQQQMQQQRHLDAFHLFSLSRRGSVDSVCSDRGLEPQSQHFQPQLGQAQHQCEFEWEADFEPGAAEAEAEAETEAEAEAEAEAEVAEAGVDSDCASYSSSRPSSSVGIVWLSNSFDFGFPPLAELLAVRT